MEKLIKLAQKNIKDLFEELKTNEGGLNEEEVNRRLKKFGYNKVISFKIDILEIIKRNILNFFNLFLLFAGFLSLTVKGIEIETILIFFFFLLSISIAIFQDYKSNKLSEKLLSYFKNYALVKRENRWQKIDAQNIVPGDYLKVTAGYLIPADLRILKAENALVNESVLTGESEPIFKTENYLESSNEKYRIPNNLALMGTTLIKGELEGVVFATGKESYLGSISKKTLEIEKKTAYQEMMTNFAKSIGLIAILVAIAIISINLFKEKYHNFQELLIFSIVLAVAIVPEFLPSMTVLTLSLAGVKLAKKGLVIKRLSSIEDLGAIEILCTDKTGTITTNQLELEKIISPDEQTFIKYFLADAYFTNEFTPYETALISKFKQLNLDEFFQEWKLERDIDFDPIKRIREIIIKNKEKEVKIIKGAPEEIIKICKVPEWLEVFYQQDKNGLRTLALAVNNQFLGIASFIDPLKETTLSAIQLAQKLNIEIKILTGDSLNVARSVALKLGLIKENDKIVSGEEIKNLNGEELKKVVKETKVFARVLPEDKLRIIEILQKDKFVGFLGEGINDAPALKIANVALAVDNATDIIKQEADIILKEKDLNTIISGIYEGRKVLENIGKYIKHTMSDNIGNLTSIATLTAILPFVPLTPLQVLLTNFLTDLPLIAFANDNVKTKELKKPLKMSSYHLILLLLSLGIVAGGINIIGYLLVKDQSPTVIRTYLFFLTTMTGLLVSFSIRTKDWFIFSQPSKIFIYISLTAILVTFILVFSNFFAKIFAFQPLNSKLLFYSLILTTIFFITNEIVKKLFYRIFPDVI